MSIAIENIIRKHQENLHPVVPFDAKKQKLAPIDLTANNTELTAAVFNDTALFSEYIDQKRKAAKAAYLIGGYNELRAVYGRSELFDAAPSKSPPVGETFSERLMRKDAISSMSSANKKAIKAVANLDRETIQLFDNEVAQVSPTGGDLEGAARRLHLGTDIWGPVSTPVFAPLGGMIHSFAFNDNYGDYGATLILTHQLDGFPFYTLYGHLSLRDIEHLSAGHYVNRGQKIAHFGEPHENGHWPPHLHFQVILDMELYEGDYPGVCRYSEREKYLANCPDPDVVLRMNRWTTTEI
ncbi:MAG: peptidoglycan DD-metalloendopeptidase family protein [Chitinophagaceae bacterium]